MSLKKTACLASLLLSVPLAAPTLSVAVDFDEHKDIDKTEGDAISGTKDEPQEEAPATGTYDKIYIGHAERQGTAEGKVEASYNTGIFKNDITLNASGKIYGGSATNSDKTSKESVDMTLEANWNNIILKKGGSITTNSTSNSNSQIYGGYAVSYSTKSGSAEASHNTITIEEGARLIENGRPKDSSGNEYIPWVCLYGGHVTVYSGSVSATSSDNTITINENASLDATLYGYVGFVSVNASDDGTCDVTANNNTFNFTNADVTLGDSFTVGHVATSSAGKAIANDNTATLILGETGTVKGQFIVGCANHVAKAGEALTEGNKLTVSGGKFEKGTQYPSYFALYTGYSWGWGTVYANKNITSLTNVEHNGSVYGGMAETFFYNPSAEKSTKAYANENVTTIKDSTMATVKCGYASDGIYAEAQKNTLSMSGGSVKNVFAGMADILNYFDEADSKRESYAYQNALTLQDVESKSFACAGYARALNYKTETDTSASTKTATAKENTLTAAGGSSVVAYAGFAQSDNVADALNNKVYLNYDPENEKNLDTATEVKGSLYGGYAYGTKAKATGNNGVLNNTTFSAENGVFAGGSAESAYNDSGEAVASSNIFTVSGGKLANAYGGQAVSENSSSAKAEGNELTLNGAEVRATLYGGYAESTVNTETDADAVSGTASAKTNKLFLHGGTYNDDIYGGYASTTNSTAESGSNTVGLYALDATTSPSFSASTVIWGGYASAGGTEVASTDNTLTFNDVNKMTAANIRNFQNLTFRYATTTLATNDVVMTLTGGDDKEKTTIADGGKISVSVTSLKGEGSEAVFKKDDKVYLLKNENGLVLDEGALSLETVTAKTGNGALECTIELKNDENSLYLTRTDSDSDDGKKDDAIKAAPETKSIAEGALAGLALASEASEAVFEVIDEIAEQDIFTFGTAHASNMTYESGSKINLSSVSVIAGLGKGFDTDAGYLSVGAFFEYGKGSYTTHNSFDDRGDINGDGNSWYMGGGILGKMIFKDTGPGHFYVEGSAHMGTVHNEFNSNDFTDDNGNVAKFDMDSPYYSLHGGLGYVWNMAEDHELKVYGKYIWTMVQGTDDTLSTNAKFDYDDMHSNRVRGGVRYSYTGSERFKPYVGVAYEHEFSGSCDSRAFGYDVNSPSYEGDTGIGELGFTMTPSDTLPLSFNLGVQGSVGKKQGVSGTCNVVYEF